MMAILLNAAAIFALGGLVFAWGCGWLIFYGRGFDRFGIRPAAMVAVVLLVLAAMTAAAAIY